MAREREIVYEIKVIRKEEDVYVAVLTNISGPLRPRIRIPLEKRETIASARSGWGALQELANRFKNMGFMD